MAIERGHFWVFGLFHLFLVFLGCFGEGSTLHGNVREYCEGVYLGMYKPSILVFLAFVLVVFFVPREGQIWVWFWVGAGVVLLDAFLVLKSIP